MRQNQILMKPTFLLCLLFSSITLFAKEKKAVLYANGKVQYEYEVEGNFFDGRFSSYYESGRLRMKGQFRMNQKTGQWRVWDEKGLLRSERNYTDNENFTIVSECDSNGVKIRRNLDMSQASPTNDYSDYLFSQRYLSTINKADAANAELFEEDGLVRAVLHEVMSNRLAAFNEDGLVTTVKKQNILPYTYRDVVALLVKEEYYCTFSKPSMSNKLLGLCPVVLENGKRKELGWINVQDIADKTELVDKIKKHAYASIILKTSVNDPSFKLRDVDPKDDELVRLALTEFEANVILYTLDKEIVASK
jgi:hypothetical protein